MGLFVLSSAHDLKGLSSGPDDDVIVGSGVPPIPGAVCARTLLVSAGCAFDAGEVYAGEAHLYGDSSVRGRAVIGTLEAHGNVRFGRGVRFEGPAIIRGDLCVLGGEMVTDHPVVVLGKARFDHRPAGSGQIFCDDAGPAGAEDGV